MEEILSRGRMDRTHSHPIDMLLYRDEYGSPEMWAIFSEEYIIKKWLFMDAAIAEVKANWALSLLRPRKKSGRKRPEIM